MATDFDVTKAFRLVEETLARDLADSTEHVESGRPNWDQEPYDMPVGFIEAELLLEHVGLTQPGRLKRLGADHLTIQFYETTLPDVENTVN